MFFTVDPIYWTLLLLPTSSKQPTAMWLVVRRVCGVAARAQAQSQTQRRTFSVTARRLDTYAFIGLGQMVCDVLSV